MNQLAEVWLVHSIEMHCQTLKYCISVFVKERASDTSVVACIGYTKFEIIE
jgi:hypothetical protein